MDASVFVIVFVIVIVIVFVFVVVIVFLLLRLCVGQVMFSHHPDQMSQCHQV